MNHSFERRWSRRLFFAAALLPLVVGLAICLMVVIVDPLDLRPWGLKPQFYDGNYPELVTPLLIVLVVCLAFVAFLAIGRPVLRRLAVRQLSRRPAEASRASRPTSC